MTKTARANHLILLDLNSSKYSSNIPHKTGPAVTPAVSCQLPTAKVRIQSQDTPWRICGEWGGTGTGFSTSISASSYRLPYSKLLLLIRLLTVLYTKPLFYAIVVFLKKKWA